MAYCILTVTYKINQQMNYKALSTVGKMTFICGISKNNRKGFNKYHMLIPWRAISSACMYECMYEPFAK